MRRSELAAARPPRRKPPPPKPASRARSRPSSVPAPAPLAPAGRLCAPVPPLPEEEEQSASKLRGSDARRRGASTRYARSFSSLLLCEAEHPKP